MSGDKTKQLAGAHAERTRAAPMLALLAMDRLRYRRIWNVGRRISPLTCRGRVDRRACHNSQQRIFVQIDRATAAIVRWRSDQA
jgi:hypothetical protein